MFLRKLGKFFFVCSKYVNSIYNFLSWEEGSLILIEIFLIW